jgi:hypothetical protein
MGSDNLFEKRKAKTALDLQRQAARRAVYQRILIVCEGEKTEPNYFKEAREFYCLNTVNVEVRGDCGSDPMSIVQFAKQRFKEEKNLGNSFDRIYCVFDKDGHAKYTDALQAIADAVPKNIYFAINSVPCFEYWLLLHFTYSTRPYLSKPRKSSGDQVLDDLKKEMPNYKKGQRTIFSDLHVDPKANLEEAKNRAKRSLIESQKNGTDNPSTRVHELIQMLQNLKR